MNNDTTIGQNVRRYRRFADITQAELGNHIEVSTASIQNYESGKTRIFADLIRPIAAYLGCDIMDLFEGVET